MTQRNLLIHVQVDADKYHGQTDEQIMEQLFQGNSLPGGATVRAITPMKRDRFDWIPLEDLIREHNIGKITHP